MDFKSVVESVYESVHTFVDCWLFKAAISFYITVFSSPEFSALSAFIALIFVDLITKWLAVSWKYLNDQGIPSEDIDILRCSMSMWQAFKSGYINSNAMKHRFCAKILWYLIVTISAAETDTILASGGEAKVFLHSAWVYLALTEASSILENLRDAGVKQASDLHGFLKEKLNITLERFRQK